MSRTVPADFTPQVDLCRMALLHNAAQSEGWPGPLQFQLYLVFWAAAAAAAPRGPATVADARVDRRRRGPAGLRRGCGEGAAGVRPGCGGVAARVRQGCGGDADRAAGERWGS